jgi:hypothetical protein
MPSDAEKAKLRFDLANSNFQSIGKAQRLYVTALLAYICLVWANFFVGSGDVSLHLAWLDLKVNGIWTITPFVILILTLAYIGTITAQMPALAQLREAEKEVFGAAEHSFFSIDTNKNIIDYFAVLQFSPRGKTHTPTDFGPPFPMLRRLPNLILPIVFIGSAFTSLYAVLRVYHLPSWHKLSFISGCFCLIVQIAYSVRPTYRFVARFLGAKRTSDVFN